MSRPDPAVIKASLPPRGGGPLAAAARQYLADQGDEEIRAQIHNDAYNVGDIVTQGRRVGVVVWDAGSGLDGVVAVLSLDEAGAPSWRLRPLDGNWQAGGALPAEVTEVPVLSFVAV